MLWGAASDLRQRLVAVLADAEPPTEERLHQARILAKRLRYTLEPLTAAAGNDALSATIALQDLLGSARDLGGVLASLDGEMPSADVASAFARLRSRAAREREDVLARLAASWLGKEPAVAALAPVDRLLDHVRQDLADSLEPPGPQGGG